MKTALITGGNKGIGLAAAKGLIDGGFKVYIGVRDRQRGEDAVKELGNNAEALLIDVSDEASIENAAASFKEPLDVLVNNAGVFLDQSESPLEVSKKIISDTLETNLFGPLLVTRAFLPHLKKAGKAEVINISSGMGQLSEMGGGSISYRISKTGLNTITKVLAAELRQYKIHVNSICPGWVKTDMGGAGASRTPEQGADTIVWLASGGGKGESGAFYRDRQKISW